jgi:hypothetical protein
VRVWKRPVNVLTMLEGKAIILRFDGKEQTSRQRSSVTGSAPSSQSSGAST